MSGENLEREYLQHDKRLDTNESHEHICTGREKTCMLQKDKGGERESLHIIIGMWRLKRCKWLAKMG